jgi:methionyl-tRNA synthetase
MRKILITAGLPYANGPIHLGHLVEYVQADIWARFQKIYGNDCLYICGDDAHGTPIMLKAEQEGLTPEKLIAHIHQEHASDLANFLVSFDNFYITHSSENKELTEEVYKCLLANNDIEKRHISQAYDPIKKMFLPDRFVKGECPCCGAKNQYGDNCEACGSTYLTSELKNPISAISGAIPIQKTSEHYFFRLEKYTSMLQQWIDSDAVQPEIKNKINEWFKEGLKSWDISRDAPYFGFAIPGTENKYFYVWLDAPIGYIASFKNLCSQRQDLNFDDYWKNSDQTELYHFIGKDIFYFHVLFWPAILTSANFRKPNAIFVHGYLTINNQKLSKSRGLFITAKDYLKYLDPEYLRYYFAAKLSSHIDDIDLSLEDFRTRINSDLVGKVINIASRCAKFINNQFNSTLSAELSEPKLFEEFAKTGDHIAKLFEQREYSQAVREIMLLADRANAYIDEKKPWSLAKQEGQEIAIQDICSMGLNLFRTIMIYLKPILPKTAINVEDFLDIPPQNWQSSKTPLLDHKINEFKPLMQRIEKEKIATLNPID